MSVYFKDLTKKEKKHLKETAGCTTLEQFKRTAASHVIMRREYEAKGYKHMEPCYECKHIAHKLGLEI